MRQILQVLHALQGDRAGDVLQPARGDQRGDGGDSRVPGGNQGCQATRWMDGCWFTDVHKN